MFSIDLVARRRDAVVAGTGVALKLGDQVSLAPADLPLDMLQPEDVFTFNCEFDSAGSPELSPTALNPCHNISAYTNLYLRREPITSNLTCI